VSGNKVNLGDKYDLDSGRIYLTGTQALVRLLLVQRRRDLMAGLNTAGFISGYRGSPMTAIDQELWRVKDQLERHHVTFWPATNEHLAATSVWGTQGVHYFGDQKYDGVFGMWYGKGPGLDQSLDAIRQGNYHGSAANGGVLILAGDDPAMRSTVDAYHSELLFEDLLMPVLYPADIQEVFQLGLHGIALSRFSGAWVGYKLLPETIETAASIEADHAKIEIIRPEFAMPEGGLNSRNPDNIYIQEARLRQYKLPAAVAYARANRLNAVTHDAPNARFGIAAMGKTWRDTLQALRDLGIEEDDIGALGIRILKVGMPFPVDEETYREFSNGLEEILVIEDKREQIENALRKVCYSLPGHLRPKITGRHDENGKLQVPNFGDLSPDVISRVLVGRLGSLMPSSASERISFLDSQAAGAQELAPLPLARLPYFCSGCPHNTSTRVPDGSRANAGVGCHYMATWMNRNVGTYTQMGGEGIPWIGQAPFVESGHVFQQLGDGTYYHSGSVAIRASIAAGTNITYKILYNDAVAMTGGQPVDGTLTVPIITRQVRNEGVQRIAIVTDEPEKYRGVKDLASGTTVHHRRELDSVQREMREVGGVSVLVYDQTCAAEKRRRRKRGTYPDPAKRMFINARVCEGCGDCGEKSNCVSVLPLKTIYGTKRQIDQSSCNKDYSCNEGFCPSFVTVLGGRPRRGEEVSRLPKELESIPAPSMSSSDLARPYGILLCGVGGTGVVTLGAIVGMAAHIEGKGVSIVDQLGFAQKGGPVQTHIRIAPARTEIHSARLNAGNTDLLLGCDSLVASGNDALSSARRGSSHAVVNVHETITGDFSQDPDLEFPAAAIENRLRRAFDDSQLDLIEATMMSNRLMGDATSSNIFLLGYAWQKGLVPLEEASIMEAIELNGVEVEKNRRSFGWGRRAAHDPAAVRAVIDRASDSRTANHPATTDSLVRHFADELIAYQDQPYADRFHRLVRLAQDAETSRAPGKDGFTQAVARYAFKLMAYKDEYEIGRLHSGEALKQQIGELFEGDYRLEFNLSPPLLARRDKATGRPRKMRFGSWMIPLFGLLARLKFLRGTPFDPFGWTAERRMERALVESYFRTIEELAASLEAENHALAVEIASLPERIRGFGYIKEKNVAEVRRREQELLESWRLSGSRAKAA
jgi:indolepyruvate ferredoxin oxidoreductase